MWQTLYQVENVIMHCVHDVYNTKIFCFILMKNLKCYFIERNWHYCCLSLNKKMNKVNSKCFISARLTIFRIYEYEWWSDVVTGLLRLNVTSVKLTHATCIFETTKIQIFIYMLNWSIYFVKWPACLLHYR